MPTDLPEPRFACSFYGISSAKDRFGLPMSVSLLESSEDRAKRVALTNELIADVFAVACRHLGDKEARKSFNKAAAAPRGTPAGTRKSNADLLALFDEVTPYRKKWCPQLKESQLPHDFARHLVADPDFRAQFTGTCEQIAARIQKLLRKRSTERAAKAAEAEKRKRDFRASPVWAASLLGGPYQPDDDSTGG